ncbi:MAG TPA: hypothetical protein VNW06_00130, partial [Cytophagaceae bacterium]|nr:hypothetical protein [Cytophagaceae bacterium]
KLSLYPSAIMIRKDCFDVLGKQDQTMQSGDHDFMCRLMFQYKGCIIYSSLVKIRKHDKNHSSLAGILCFDEYIITLEKFYRRKLITNKIYRTMVSDNLYQSGILYYRNASYRNAKEKFIKSFNMNIFNYKGFIRYLMCFFK